MSHKILFIRADASAEIGAGHVMRCLALAQAWHKTGGRTIFALAAGAELKERIISEGATVASIEAEPGSDEDADQTMNLCTRSRADWVVLDGYHFSAGYCRAISHKKADAGFHLLLLNDGGEAQPCDCDIVVNPDPDAVLGAYNPREGRQKFLLGPRYALLRREFLESRVERAEVAERAQRVLVTFGGGDAHNVTLQVVRALLDLTNLGLNITVVAGASYQHRASLEAAIAGSPLTAKLVSNAENMPDLMARAELAITAGGGTCYELAFMKVPMFLITMAKNHERAVEAYAEAGAAVSAGWFSALNQGALAASLRRVISDQELRRKLVENAARMVDGKGAERTVKAMLAISQSGKNVAAEVV